MRSSCSVLLLVTASQLLAQGQAAPVLEPATSGTTARLQAISVASPTVAWASGVQGSYTRTVDGGKTWRPGTVPGADSLEFRDVHAFTADRAVLLASGTGDKSRIYRTIDGGKTWATVFTNKEPKGFFDCFDFKGDVGIAVGDEVNGTLPLLQSTDAGKTWKPYAPPGYEKIKAVTKEGAFAASGTCIVLRPDWSAMIVTATTGRVIHVGPSSSVTYTTPLTREKENAGLFTLAFRLSNVGIAAGGDLGQADAATDNVVMTRDGGRTWTLGGRPTFGGAAYGAAYVPGKSRVAVLVGPKGSSWTADDGASWKKLDDQDHWSVAFGPEGTGWMVGPAGRITKITFK